MVKRVPGLPPHRMDREGHYRELRLTTAERLSGYWDELRPIAQTCSNPISTTLTHANPTEFLLQIPNPGVTLLIRVLSHYRPKNISTYLEICMGRTPHLISH